jgi:hypothetical protein
LPPFSWLFGTCFLLYNSNKIVSNKTLKSELILKALFFTIPVLSLSFAQSYEIQFLDTFNWVVVLEASLFYTEAAGVLSPLDNHAFIIIYRSKIVDQTLRGFLFSSIIKSSYPEIK